MIPIAAIAGELNHRVRQGDHRAWSPDQLAAVGQFLIAHGEHEKRPQYSKCGSSVVCAKCGYIHDLRDSC